MCQTNEVYSVSICGDSSLYKSDGRRAAAKCLYCRSWGCEICRPKRKAKLMAEAADGLPTKFLTLTVNPTLHESADERRQHLTEGFNLLIKALRRLKPDADIQYFWVVERTQAGEPHLHALLRMPYVPQATLSKLWEEITGAFVVDIRKVRGTREAVRYLAKYIGKAPQQFANFKRYGQSKGWQLHLKARPLNLDDFDAIWRLVFKPLEVLDRELQGYGFAGRGEWDKVRFYFPMQGAPPRGDPYG